LQNSINADGSPNLLTVWIALSEATPLNGCMYMVPMDRSGKAHETKDAKNLDFNLPSLRALPAKTGDLLMWNHWVIHWGARASKQASEPRISMAFELEREGSNIHTMPLINPTQIPSFEARLKLIAFQIQQYTHMYKFSQQMLNFSKEILENAIAR
jgi:ectoine hydroxylase-related dioxygenase (phytanoyl-CoA dioxygenase family)